MTYLCQERQNSGSKEWGYFIATSSNPCQTLLTTFCQSKLWRQFLLNPRRRKRHWDTNRQFRRKIMARVGSRPCENSLLIGRSQKSSHHLSHSHSLSLSLSLSDSIFLSLFHSPLHKHTIIPKLIFLQKLWSCSVRGVSCLPVVNQLRP